MKQFPFVLGMLIVPVALLVAGVVWGNSVTTPNVFVGGTTAVASDVNENFAALAAAINDNDARLDAIESQMAAAPTAQGTLRGYVIFLGQTGNIQRSWMADGGTVSVNRNGTGDYSVTWGDEFWVPAFDPTLLHIFSDTDLYRSTQLSDSGDQRIQCFLGTGTNEGNASDPLRITVLLWNDEP